MSAKPKKQVAPEEAPQKQTMVKDQEQTRILQDLLKTKKELLVEQITQYAMLNEQVKALQARQKIVRPHIENALKTEGQKDTSGHLHVCQIDIDGVEAIYQRRAPIVFNPLVAEEVLRELGIWERCIDVEDVHTVRETISQDKIEQAFEAGLIPKNLFDCMFTENESYALIVQVDDERNPEYSSIKSLRKALESEAKREATKFAEVTSE
jgi:hypothetical protein